MTQLPPHVTAKLDQLNATLRTIVGWSIEHRAAGCEVPGSCPGGKVYDAVTSTDPGTLHLLMFAAVVELAQRGYGQDPTPGVEPPGEVIRVRNGDEDLYFVRAATADDDPDSEVCWLSLVPTDMALPYSMLASDPDNPPVYLREARRG